MDFRPLCPRRGLRPILSTAWTFSPLSTAWTGSPHFLFKAGSFLGQKTPKNRLRRPLKPLNKLGQNSLVFLRLQGVLTNRKVSFVKLPKIRGDSYYLQVYSRLTFLPPKAKGGVLFTAAHVLLPDKFFFPTDNASRDSIQAAETLYRLVTRGNHHTGLVTEDIAFRHLSVNEQDTTLAYLRRRVARRREKQSVWPAVTY